MNYLIEHLHVVRDAPFQLTHFYWILTEKNQYEIYDEDSDNRIERTHSLQNC